MLSIHNEMKRILNKITVIESINAFDNLNKQMHERYNSKTIIN